MKHTLTKLDYKIIEDFMEDNKLKDGFGINNMLIYFLEYYKKVKK